MVFWGIFATVMLVGIFRHFNVIFALKVTKAEWNLGIKSSGLSQEKQNKLTNFILEMRSKGITSVPRLTTAMFVYLSKEPIPPEALYPCQHLYKSINHIVDFIKDNEALQEAGHQYLANLMMSVYTKIEHVESASDKEDHKIIGNYIGDYLLRNCSDYRNAVLEAHRRIKI